MNKLFLIPCVLDKTRLSLHFFIFESKNIAYTFGEFQKPDLVVLDLTFVLSHSPTTSRI